MARIARALFLSALSAARERIREDPPRGWRTNRARLKVPSGRVIGSRGFIVPLRMKASYFSFPRSSYFSATRPSTAPPYISSSPYISLYLPLLSSYRETEAPRLIFARRHASLFFSLPLFLLFLDIKPSWENSESMILLRIIIVPRDLSFVT